MNGLVVYIAGPYLADTVHGIVENIRRAEVAALDYWRRGYAVIHIQGRVFWRIW